VQDPALLGRTGEATGKRHFVFDPGDRCVGADPNANRGHVLKAGARAFLLKPADNDRLLSTNQQILGEKDQTAEVVYDLGGREG
jgi:hypothetical protein